MGVWRHSTALVGAAVGAPLGLAALALRPKWRQGWRERVGVVSPRRPGAIWVHGASVGEILAAGRLMDHLLKAGQRVCASTSTPWGRAVMHQTRPDIPCQLAPLDHPWCVDAALSRVAPCALVLIETELWPVWIGAAARRGVPVVLVSGRLSDRSFPRYRRLGRVMSTALRRMEAIGARTAGDRERFIALGADPDRVTTTGDLKLEHDDMLRPLPPDLAASLGQMPLFVAGSTHPGEEKSALGALRAVENAGLRAGLVIAPRHVERAGEVERIVRSAGRKAHRRTTLGDHVLREGEVLVLDTLGELAAVYAHADVVFVGGSLVPVGGHNVLEPALAGRPVLFGRHTADVRHAVEILETCGAGWRLADDGELARAVVTLLHDPEAARARGEAGSRALQHHRGSAERAAALIVSAVEKHAG